MALRVLPPPTVGVKEGQELSALQRSSPRLRLGWETVSQECPVTSLPLSGWTLLGCLQL